MNLRLVSTKISAASIVLLLAGCGAHPGGAIADYSKGKSSNGEGEAAASDGVTPPKEYYDALLSERMLALDSGKLDSHSEQVLWINFNGAIVNKGYGTGQSFIVCKQSATIPASGYTTSEQTEIVQEVAQYYSNAGVSIALTFDQPKTGDYTTIHVGGRYADLGCGNSSSTLGIAPLDSDNANPNDIGFAFVPSSKDLTTQAMTIAHEAGHSFGLDHSNNRADLMYPSVSSAATGFAKGNVQGRGTQDGPLVLQKNLGSGFASVTGSAVQPAGPIPTPVPTPTPSNPTFPNTPAGNPSVAGLPGVPTLGGLGQIISQLTPSIIASINPMLPTLGGMPGGTSISNPSSILSALTIFQNGVVKQNGGTFNMGNILGSLTGQNATGFGSSIFSILGLATGNPMSIASTLLPIILPKVSSSSQTKTQAMDLTALFGMTNVSNQGALISQIPQYAQMIRVNATGTKAQTLTDALKLAVSQKYVTIGSPTP